MNDREFDTRIVKRTSIFGWVREALGYGEAATAVRMASLKAQKLEDERLELEYLIKTVLYDIYNTDTKTRRLIFKLRNHPKLRRAYIDPLIIAGLVMLLHLLPFLHVLEYFTGKH